MLGRCSRHFAGRSDSVVRPAVNIRVPSWQNSIAGGTTEPSPDRVDDRWPGVPTGAV
jgi:hypothetical protein